jgi:hypothetical protein
MLMATQLSVPGLYRPPVFKRATLLSSPPHMIISLPVQIAVCESRPTGALAMLVAVQLPVVGLYLPPVFERPILSAPPQIIISDPVHTAV